MKHTHAVNHDMTSRADNGTTYEHCDCGAIRVTRRGEKVEPWHACKLCVLDTPEKP